MPQQLLHHLELSPHASQQGRVGVTERMPSESLLNSDSLSCRTYVFAQDRLAPVRSSASIALACKNPVLRPDVGTTFSPLRQSVRESDALALAFAMIRSCTGLPLRTRWNG